jgi:hypothetical protein
MNNKRLLALIIMLILPSFLQFAIGLEINVMTEKDEYLRGETVVVLGNVSEVIIGQAIAIRINDPDGNMWAIAQTQPNSDGSFRKEVARIAEDAKLGNYKVFVSYAGKTATYTFKVISKKPSTTTISLSSGRIKFGSSVEILVTISPALSEGLIVVEYVKNGEWLEIASGKPKDGQFSYLWSPKHAGTYTLRARWNGTIKYLGSNSSIITLVVEPVETKLELLVSPDKVTIGSHIQLTITSKPKFNGTITIEMVRGRLVKTLLAELVNGYVEVKLLTNITGKYVFKAIWDGSKDYLASESEKVSIDVLPKVNIMKIVADGKTFTVIITTNSTVSNLELVKEEKSLNFISVAPKELTIKTSIQVPMELVGGEYIIKVAGAQTKFDEQRNQTHATLTFTYNATEQGVKISVIGTKVIPEFLTSQTIFAATILLSMAGILLAKKRK